jgi:single-strand DNA-binding protein
MGAMNRVFLMGNLTRDPELRTTPSGIAVSDLGLAVSEKYKNKAGEMVETVCFADIVVWGRQAEACRQYLGKGAPVMVEGRLQLDQWQTDKGEKRSRLRVRADRVQFLGRSKQHEEASPSSPVPAGVVADGGDSADESSGGKPANVEEMPF